ncbi:FxsA family protein [Campylobacter sp. RM16192]|uniref:FxsA family protein n=1 Tax=Campylobacter sp. RM16192 TaxID=1660080 RepID=UPI0014519861|nr:FxsA family protein [Campylobacter sp. RM16192]QCD52419.1 putative membrane protein [Campylobacter sp. RM16192]
MLRRLFLPYIIIEMFALYLFVNKYGFFNFVLEVILTAILGSVIMFRVGFVQFFSRAMFIRVSDIFGALGIAIGGFFILIPGLVSDFLGIAILILSMFTIFKNLNNTKNYSEFKSRSKETKNSENIDIIDVEIVEESKTIKNY